MSDTSDHHQIDSLYRTADAALMRADIAALAEIFADDYIQYDPSGHAHTKQAILETLCSGEVRYPSIVSTSRIIRLFGETAVVHGSENDIVETRGQRSEIRYLYLDALIKRGGKWKLVASLLARPAENAAR